MPRESHFRYETAMCMLAARGGQLPTLQYLRATGWQWDGTTCEGAASRGHIKVKKEGCFVCVCVCVRACVSVYVGKYTCSLISRCAFEWWGSLWKYLLNLIVTLF